MLSAPMAVQSRLKIILAERNVERMRAGDKPWTIRELAAELSLSASVISGLTSNRARRVDFETLSKLCRKLSCTPGDLLAFDPSLPDDPDEIPHS